MVRSFGARSTWFALMTLLAAFAVLTTGVLAQDSGEFVLSETDTSLNMDFYMGGAKVYCVNEFRMPWPTYENGGGFLVLDPQGEEILFVPEAAIEEGIAQVEQTGQYATLGVSERLWYGGAPIAIYYLPSGEFQINAADEWEKPVEFRWTECRNVTVATSDGCKPGWDRNASGRCVYENLY
ncbi:MAG: hypothetical protein DIU68_005230 [Chloroflexota bacterium]|nr:MAG: hypothetical protein DIU68_01045 [Chloroflexota bacterium]